jgi:proline dehydrogenase
MGLARRALLWASQNRTLRQRLPRYRFVRRAVRKFMPGETLDDALGAAKSLAARRIPTTLTQLGENVTNPEEAAVVTDQYLEALARVAELGLDTEISVKPTHLGLDFDPELAFGNTERLAARAAELGNWLWVDMEASASVDGTLDLYRRLRNRFEHVGVCLQAYLRRTRADMNQLLKLGASIRLVKGAYRERAELLVGKKRDVDESYLELALLALIREERGRLAFGTHDVKLIDRIEAAAIGRGVGREAFEVQMLYGIRQADQFRLAGAGYRVRTLIAYGSSWYPWYMRRLAERPANLFFVARNVFQRAPVGGP